MRCLLPAAVCAGLLVFLSACSGAGAPPSTEASQSPPASSLEDGNVGVCHSLSVELMTLDAVVLGYESGNLDRASFDYMVGSIAKGFPLLGILHPDSNLTAEVDALRSAIQDLAAAGSEPATGDASAVGEAKTAIADACESAGAPLSVYQ